jgi:hypothetical protein
MGVKLDLTDEEFRILYEFIFEDTTDCDEPDYGSLMHKLLDAKARQRVKPKQDPNALWEALKGAIGR